MRPISLLRVALATVSGAGAWVFFDQAKHNPALAASAGFLDDPYDAVGSFGIQCGAVGACIALLWLIAEWRTRQRGLESRGALLTGATSAIVGVADLVAQTAGPSRGPGNVWIWLGIVGLIVLGGVGVALNVRGEPPGRGLSLLRLAGAANGGWRPLFGWVDTHALLSGLGLALASGLALAISHQLLEGGPDTFGDLLILSAVLIAGEGAFVAAAWLVLGQWLGIHQGVRAGRGSQKHQGEER